MSLPATAINTRMGISEWLLLLTLSVLWGGSFFFVEVAVGALPPLTIVVLRVGLAAVALNVVVAAAGGAMPRDARVWFAFAIMGLLNNAIPFTLIVWGQVHIASGLASILNGLTPMFTVIVAHLFLSDERLSGQRLAGVLIGFAGAVLTIGPSALRDIGVELWAQLAVTAATLSYAFASVYGRRFTRAGLTPLVAATGQVTMSTLLLIPVVLAVDQPWQLANPHIHVWLAVVGVALASTALAYIVYFRLLATAGAVNLMLVTLLLPVTAILLGAAVLGERLDREQLAGLAVIACGLLVLDGRILKLVKA